MSAITYDQLALSWRPESRRNHTFNFIAIITLALFLSAGLILSSVQLPKEERLKQTQVPERVAKFVTERPRPKPKQEQKPPPKPLSRPEPKFERKKTEPSKPLTKIEEKARKTAEQSGLLALTRDLSDLMDTSSVNQMVGKKISQSKDTNAAATVSTDVITSAGKKGSGGVGNATHVGSVGNTTLDNNQRELAQKLLASKGQIPANSGALTQKQTTGAAGRNDTARAEEDIAYVMDKHKSMLHSIYRRARRHNPGLKGKIVLAITILPTGKVSNVIIKSSELNDPKLESSLLARIRQFDFGPSSAETLTVIVPVEFLPS